MLLWCRVVFRYRLYICIVLLLLLILICFHGACHIFSVQAKTLSLAECELHVKLAAVLKFFKEV